MFHNHYKQKRFSRYCSSFAYKLGILSFLYPPLCFFLADSILSQMGQDGRVGGASVGQGWCWHLISPHTLRRSGSHLKHMLLLSGCVRFGSSRGKDTDTGFKRQGIWSLDKQTLKREDGNTQANKKASFEAAGPAAVGVTSGQTSRQTASHSFFRLSPHLRGRNCVATLAPQGLFTRTNRSWIWMTGDWCRGRLTFCNHWH